MLPSVMLLNHFLFIFLSLAASAASYNVSELLLELPTCSLDCIVQGLTSSPEVLADPTLSCRNNTLQATMTGCILKACNFTEQEQVGVVNAQVCVGVPIQSRAVPLAIVALVCVPLALIAVVMRCYSRYVIMKRLGPDDWSIVVVALLLIVLLVLDVYNCFIDGFGRHIWNFAGHKVAQGLKIFYVCEILYIVVITLAKTSICLFYLRVFPESKFRAVLYVTTAVVIASGIVPMFTVIFQCTPFAAAWNKAQSFKCINLHKLAYAIGAIGVTLDLWIIVLPIPQCLKLQMTRKKKINVIIMSSLGSVALVTSAIRLKYLVDFANDLDQTWDNAIAAGWSIAEVCSATICACLPAIRAILCKWYPAVFDFDSDTECRLSDISKLPSLLPISSSPPTPRNDYKKDYSGRWSPTLNGPLSLGGPMSLVGSNGQMSAPVPTSKATPQSTDTTKVWINPIFDEQGNVIERHESRTTESPGNSIFVARDYKQSPMMTGDRLYDGPRETITDNSQRIKLGERNVSSPVDGPSSLQPSEERSLSRSSCSSRDYLEKTATDDI